MIVVSGLTFYLTSHDVFVTALAMSITLGLFGGLALYVHHWRQSHPPDEPSSHSNSLRTLIFALAVASQVSLALRAPDAVPIGFLVIMGLVAIVDQVVRHRQRAAGT